MISLAHLTAIDANPAQLIYMAAEAGYDAVGLRMTKVTDNSPGYPLMSDLSLRKETLNALQKTGLKVNDIEFIKITPEFDPHSLITLLDTGQALGAKKLITAPYDDHLPRLSEKLAAISELALPRGIQPVLEFFPWTSVPNYQTAHQVVSQAGNGVGILLDTLHFDRSGSSLADLERLGTELISMIHLCDAPVQSSYTTAELLHCAREARLPPGQGAIALSPLLKKMPKGLPIGLEVPMAPSGELSSAQQRHIVQQSIVGARQVLTDCGYL